MKNRNRAQSQANNFTYFEVKKTKKKRDKKRKKGEKKEGMQNKFAVARFSQDSYGIQQPQGFLKMTKINKYSMYPTEGACMKLDVFRNS